MRAIHQKLVRDLWHMRGAVITIALVVAAGVSAYVTLHGTWLSIKRARDGYYSAERFGDVFAQFERAPLALVEKIATGRSAGTRPTTAKELAQTAVLALPLIEVAAKVRNGPVADDEEDYALPYWAGIVPLRQAFGEPQPDAGVRELPEYLRAAVTGVTA